MRGRVIGILGGMGPESTVKLFSEIVRNTPAREEQDHLRIIIDNNPQIPDRTKAILEGGQSPLPELEKSIRNLEKCNADLIAIPCNTVFYFYDDMQNMTSIPIIHTIEECVNYVKTNKPELRMVGLLATTGTIRSGLYQERFSRIGIEVISPPQEAQRTIMEIIYGQRGIKAGYRQLYQEAILRLARNLVNSGAQAIVAGCTEVEMAMDIESEVMFIKPLQILANVIIAMGK